MRRESFTHEPPYLLNECGSYAHAACLFSTLELIASARRRSMPVLNPGTHSIHPKVQKVEKKSKVEKKEKVENKKKWKTKKNGKGRFEDNKKLLKIFFFFFFLTARAIAIKRENLSGDSRLFQSGTSCCIIHCWSHRTITWNHLIIHPHAANRPSASRLCTPHHCRHQDSVGLSPTKNSLIRNYHRHPELPLCVGSYCPCSSETMKASPPPRSSSSRGCTWAVPAPSYPCGL